MHGKENQNKQIKSQQQKKTAEPWLLNLICCNFHEIKSYHFYAEDWLTHLQ